MLSGDGMLCKDGVSVFLEGFPKRFSLVGFSLPSYFLWEIYTEPDIETFWYWDCCFTWAIPSLLQWHAFNCADKLDSERGHRLWRRFTAQAWGWRRPTGRISKWQYWYSDWSFTLTIFDDGIWGCHFPLAIGFWWNLGCAFLPGQSVLICLGPIVSCSE